MEEIGCTMFTTINVNKIQFQDLFVGWRSWEISVRCTMFFHVFTALLFILGFCDTACHQQGR
jgi:hypothetical protein